MKALIYYTIYFLFVLVLLFVLPFLHPDPFWTAVGAVIIFVLFAWLISNALSKGRIKM